MPGIPGRTLRAAAMGVVLLTLGACGSGDPGLATGSTSALRDQVVAVRAAATAGDAAAARSALDAFRGQVHRLVESGELDPAAAVELLAQADRVGTGLDVEPTPAAVRDDDDRRDRHDRDARDRRGNDDDED